MKLCLFIGVLSLSFSCSVYAEEADQFQSWNVELKDAAPELNRFIAMKAAEVIDSINADSPESCSCEDLTVQILTNIYLDRFRAPLLKHVEESDSITVFPERHVAESDLLDVSIYRNVKLPSIIRVTRTIRIGEVYLGTDKLPHIFGIGRRYYTRYLEMRGNGASRQESEETAIRWGIFTENSILGTIINGIFSFADLEANYQGLLLAIDFCEGEEPFLQQGAKGWSLVRPIEIESYITPLFDESYNPSQYTGNVLDEVLKVLEDDYSDNELHIRARARFAQYQRLIPNHSGKIVMGFFEEKGIKSQRSQLIEALGLTQNNNTAPVEYFFGE